MRSRKILAAIGGENSEASRRSWVRVEDDDIDEYLQGYHDPQLSNIETIAPPSASSGKTSCFGRFRWRRPSDDLGTQQAMTSPGWWWWEIGAAMVGILCTALEIGMLGAANHTSLASWPLLLRPNTVLSTLSTIGKSAFLVTISGCLSQLKWRHFWYKARPLSHLQRFEDASRGPWGAMVFFRTVNIEAATACLLAVLTVLGLAIDPMSQQVLVFPTRIMKMRNVTSIIGQAFEYQSKAYPGYRLLEESKEAVRFGTAMNALFNEDTLRIEAAMINGAVGAVSLPYFDCPYPAVKCAWEDFSSLGICSSFENLTDVAIVDCNGTDPYNGIGQYDWSGRQDPDPKISITRIGSPHGRQGTIMPDKWEFLSAMAANHEDAIGGQGLSLTIAKADSSELGKFVPFPVEFFYAHWHFCQQTFYNVRSTSKGLAIGRVVQESLTPLRNETNMPDGLNYTSITPDYTRLIYRANSTGHEYSMLKRTGMQIMSYLGNLLSVQYSINPYSQDTNDGGVGGVTLGNNNLIQMGYFLNSTDLANMTRNIAATLSAQIQSRSPGDNANITVYHGDAFVSETYILVRWPWLTLMFLEGAGTIILLAVTIKKTRGQPLVKASIIAPLVYGLKGWENEPGYTSAGISDSSSMLECRAKQISACLGEAVDGQPTDYEIYDNQSFASFSVIPKDDAQYTFVSSNSDPANAGTIKVFTVTGEGLETIVETLGSSKSATREVQKTNKPFHITIDSSYP